MMATDFNYKPTHTYSYSRYAFMHNIYKMLSPPFVQEVLWVLTLQRLLEVPAEKRKQTKVKTQT